MDRRILKTKKAINTAFLKLLESNSDVSSITVRAICDEADISRSTFYMHYTDISELLEELANQYAEVLYNIVLEKHIQTPGKSSYKEIYLTMLEYLTEQKSVIKAILLDSNNKVISEQLSSTLRKLLATYYKNIHTTIKPEILDYTAMFWTAGVYALIQDWARNDFDKTPDEMSDYITASLQTCSQFFQS